MITIAKKITAWSVLSTETPPTPPSDNAPSISDAPISDSVSPVTDTSDLLLSETILNIDPSDFPLEKSPDGDLLAIRRKIRYWRDGEDHKRYLIPSFAFRKGMHNGIEFFTQWPAELWAPDETSKANPWVAASMKSMSRLLQKGASSAEVISMLIDTPGQDTIWFENAYGKKSQFTSEVAVLGQAFLNIFVSRKIMTPDGLDVPYHQRPRYSSSDLTPIPMPDTATSRQTTIPPATTTERPVVSNAQRCAKCSAIAVILLDGCRTCVACGDAKC